MTNKYLNCFLLFIMLFIGGPAYAQSKMSDEDVYRMMLKEKQSGSSQQQIAIKLMQSGVSVDQIRRIKDKYEKENKNSLMNAKDVTGSKTRSRVNNGDKKSSVNLKRRNYDYTKFSQQDYNDYNKQQLEEYSGGLDFMFPDSMSMYDRYLMEKQMEPKIKVFGRDIFNNKKLSFESSMNIATPADYRLGPGDEVFVDIYGASQKPITSSVSPEGTIDIDNFGPVQVSGLTVKEASARLRSSLGQRYGGSKIRLTVGQTKTITVQVMGSVNVPGTYTLSAFATVFHALYMAGGVNEIGTLRAIKVFRNNRLISTVDLYDYILNGKMTGNVRLADNDVIVVGTYDCLVDIVGKVKRPMYYEMKRTESVETLLNYAGGFAGDAYQKTVRLIRKNGERYSMFTIDEFERPTFKVLDGDSIAVDSALTRFENMVTVKGAVNRPGMYELGKNIRSVRDLINMAAGLAPEAFGDHAVLQRYNKDRSLKTISLNLTAIMKNQSADVPLENEDVVYVMSNEEQRNEEVMSIFGEVNIPGKYVYSANTTIEDLIVQAGGLTDAASTMKVDVSRRIRDSKAMNTSEEIAQTFSFALKDGLIVSGDSSFTLQPYDEVFVRKSPGYVEQQHVYIQGEIAFGGDYTLNRKAERLSDLVKAAGGLTTQAYAKGARLERVLSYSEKLKQQSLLKLISNGDSVDVRKLDLGDTRFVGINLDMALQHPGDDKWDIVLEAGDRVIVPQYKNTISLNGEVMYPTTVAYNKNSNLSYYINQAGGYTQKAKTSRVFAVNMNGTVTKVRSAKDLQPGCEIVVPAKPRHNRMSLGEIIGLGTMTASLASIIAVIFK